jgi:hypothetical protein
MAVENFRKTAYGSAVRWSLLAACVLGLAVAGCYSPKVKNGGFLCSTTDNPPCPTGFYCVNQYCVDSPGVTVAGDMATSSSTDMAGVVNDLSSTDLAQAVHDFAQPGGDMTMCKASGDSCSKSAECCSGICFFNISCI